MRIVTLNLYLGVNKIGEDFVKLLVAEAKKRNLSASRFVRYCIEKVLAQEGKNEKKNLGRPNI